MAFKQNKGSSPKKMGKGRDTEVPNAGGATVSFKGTYVHASPKAGVTKPRDGAQGSHDSKVRTHAEDGTP